MRKEKIDFLQWLEGHLAGKICDRTDINKPIFTSYLTTNEQNSS